MKITRDGKTYELTAQELEQAYRERRDYYRAEDVLLHFEHNGKKCTIPYEDRVGIGADAETILCDVDLYWECYWDAFEEATQAYLACVGMKMEDFPDGE